MRRIRFLDRRNFNPRPRMGATGKMVWIENGKIFQSTPPYGGDFWFLVVRQHPGRFQSTPPYGGDALIKTSSIDSPHISIHAPVWGRLDTSTDEGKLQQFQSTPPYGGDGSRPQNCSSGPDFNPRPRMGATHTNEDFSADFFISIHAPVWGRPGTGTCNESVISFQSTPPYGGDRLSIRSSPWQKISIHAPVWGRREIIRISVKKPKFQSTPPYGGDFFRVSHDLVLL